MKPRVSHVTLSALVCLALLAAFSTSGAQAPTPPSPPQGLVEEPPLQIAPPWAEASAQLLPPPEPQDAPLRPGALEPPPPGTGFVPPPMDLSHLTGQRMPGGIRAQALPPSFDWRGTGKVTPVKNQSTCGSCYAFAALGNFESKLLIDGAGTFDLSENNAKECNWRELNNFQYPNPGDYWGSCDGGNYTMLANLFSQKGTVLESDDPYNVNDVGCTSPVTYQQTLLDWRIISGDSVPSTDVLKQYIYDNGPVYTSVYADSSQGFDNTYNGSHTFNYTTSAGDGTNHAVLIVGWSNNLPSVPGGTAPADGWIVKNSWGNSWGANGYFYMTYGAANIGMYSSFMHEWQNYDDNGDIWYYDDDGWSNTWGGCGNTTAWGLARFTPASDTYVTRVEFWTTDRTTDVDVYIYDNFNGSTTPTTLLRQSLNHSFDEAGYHSVSLASPLPVTTGDEVVAVIKSTNQVYTYPIAADKNGTPETGRTYISCSGNTWTDLGATQNNDVAIRLRTSTVLDPNVGITKRVVGSDFETGDPITFTLSIHNHGTVTATGVVVTDDLPSQVLNPTFAGTLGITHTGVSTYVWNVEPLEAGESGVITICGQIDPSLEGSFSFTNIASISDPEDDTPNNNTSHVSVTVGEHRIYLPLVLRGWPPWTTIVSEDFEGSFPGAWTVFGDGGYSWGKRDCRPYQGGYSGWVVGGGTNGSSLACGSNYPDNANTWMIYGPFSLADTTDGELSFQLWLDTELYQDTVCRFASVDGSVFHGLCTSGNTAGWMHKVLDLKDVPTLGNLMGESQVWVALRFSSDGSVNYSEGGYVDNIVLRKYVSASSAASSTGDAEHGISTGQTVDIPTTLILEKQ